VLNQINKDIVVFRNQLYKCLPLLLIIISGCATIKPYDYSALLEAAPRSILVIPPKNNSVEVSASYSYLSTISVPLAEKGYYVFPVSVIDTFLKQNGLPTPAEMNTIPLEKIKEHIGADAVLYVTIDDWGQKYTILSSSTVVRGSITLVSTDNGQTLWEAPFRTVLDSDNGNSSILSSLISAVASQIIGSINDKTPHAARIANNQALNDNAHGLLTGPYYVLKKK